MRIRGDGGANEGEHSLRGGKRLPVVPDFLPFLSLTCPLTRISLVTSFVDRSAGLICSSFAAVLIHSGSLVSTSASSFFASRKVTFPNARIAPTMSNIPSLSVSVNCSSSNAVITSLNSRASSSPGTSVHVSRYL